MNINRIESGFNTNMTLSDIKIYGVQTQPKLVSINGVLYENFIFDDVYNVSIFLELILNSTSMIILNKKGTKNILSH